MSYVYIETENWTDDEGDRHILWTVGFYRPDGKFESESDYNNRDSAAAQVSYLNGGFPSAALRSLVEACDWYLEAGVKE